MGKLQALSKKVRQVFDLQKKLDVCKYPFAFWMDTDLIAFLFCFKVVSVSSLKKPNTVQSHKAFFKIISSPFLPTRTCCSHRTPYRRPTSPQSLFLGLALWASRKPGRLSEKFRLDKIWAPQVVPQEAPGHHNP